jgi:tetratricopeptide (TPR) repeat protein
VRQERAHFLQAAIRAIVVAIPRGNPAMARDQQGLPLLGSPASAEAFDRAVADYYGLTGDPVGILKGAVERDPAFPLGSAAIAGLFMVGGFPGDHPEVTRAIGAAEATMRDASPRERRHLAAVKALAAGSSGEAARLFEDILVDHPTDALALRFIQDVYYFLGDSPAIRDSAARVLPAWDRDNPLTSFIHGLYAFGLEETGALDRAEEFGRMALAHNPSDAWAAHAMAHVMETANRHNEGIAFLRASRPSWSSAHFMAGHNGWHLALFLVEAGRFAEVLADYDRFTAPKLAGDATLDRIDAASLLWRLELADVDVGERWRPLARQWMGHVDDHVLAFNDLHLALAASRSGDPHDVARLRRSLDDYERFGVGDNRAVMAEVGRQLIEGALRFAERDYVRAIEAMLPVRYQAFRIGGSHAQRDIVNQTLIAAAERSGRWNLARALLAERVATRPTERTKQAYERARAMAARS